MTSPRKGSAGKACPTALPSLFAVAWLCLGLQTARAVSCEWAATGAPFAMSPDLLLTVVGQPYGGKAWRFLWPDPDQHVYDALPGEGIACPGAILDHEQACDAVERIANAVPGFGGPGRS
jgi:hypothetical protein